MSKHLCTMPHCNGGHLARGLCGKHYGRLRRSGTPEGSPRTRGQCRITGCSRPRMARHLCAAHYRQLLKHGDPEYSPRTDIDAAVVALAVSGMRPRVLTLGEREAAVHLLHRQGLSDPAIAVRVGMSAPGVCLARKRLGLPANALGAHTPASVRAA